VLLGPQAIAVSMDMLETENGVAFGFMPEDIVHTLLDIGNWRKRAAAMDSLHEHLHRSEAVAALEPKNFHALVGFIMRLVKDPNFKICISGMLELTHLVNTCPALMRSHVPVIMPTLVERFSDSKLMLRQTAHGVVRALMDTGGPDPTLAVLSKHMGHFAPRAREEAIDVYVYALLHFPTHAFEWSSVAEPLLVAMSDPKERVRDVALDALRVLASRLPHARLVNILLALRCPEGHRERLQARMEREERPWLDADGSVQHCLEPAGSLSHQGSAVPGTAPVTPESKFARLPFAVPSPGQAGSRGSVGRASSGLGDDAADAAPRAAPQRPKRISNLTLQSAGSHVPLSYFSEPPEVTMQLHASTTAALHKSVQDKKRDGSTDAMATPFTEPAAQWQVSERTRNSIQARSVKADAEGVGRGTQYGLLHASSLARLEAAVAARRSADSERSAQSDVTLPTLMFHKRAAQPDLAAPHHSGIASGTGRAVRDSGAIQSAPASDAPIPPTLSSESGSHSPSKAMRLQSLKQRLADRRAQSAGVPLTPVPQSPLATRKHATLASDSMHSLPTIRTDSIRSSSETQPASSSAAESFQHSLPSTFAERGFDTARRYLGSTAPQRRQASRAPTACTPLRLARDGTLTASPSGAISEPSTPASHGADPSGGLAELNLDDTAPSANPEHELDKALDELACANAAKRKELDWLKNQEAINTMRKLLRHHTEIVLEQLKGVLAAMLPCISALRSTTSRATLQFFRVGSFHDAMHTKTEPREPMRSIEHMCCLHLSFLMLPFAMLHTLWGKAVQMAPTYWWTHAGAL
jgi:hypothetical protein